MASLLKVGEFGHEKMQKKINCFKFSVKHDIFVALVWAFQQMMYYT